MDLLKSKDLYLRIFENAVLAIGVTNNTGDYILVNKAWCEFTGYSLEEAKSLNVQDITPLEDRKTSQRTFSHLMTGENNSIRKKRRYLRKDGSVFWADLYVSPIHSDDGVRTGVLGIFTDIDKEMTAEHRQNELNGYLEKLNDDLQNAHAAMTHKNEELEKAYTELKQLARHDSLTNLYNRRTLDQILTSEIQRSIRTHRGFAVAISDIDDFKKINDTYGHDCGDYVLKALSRIFLDKIRTSDTVGRWGGEEFMFIFPETTCEGARIVLERIRVAVAEHEFCFANVCFPVSITSGFSFHTSQDKVDIIVKEADTALYKGKNNGKNQVVCYQKSCELAEAPSIARQREPTRSDGAH